MGVQSSRAKASAIIAASLIGAAALFPIAAQAEGSRKALNMFGDMVDTMAGIAARQEAARAEAQPKCWTEKRSTKSAGKTVTKTVKVCE